MESDADTPPPSSAAMLWCTRELIISIRLPFRYPPPPPLCAVLWLTEDSDKFKKLSSANTPPPSSNASLCTAELTITKLLIDMKTPPPFFARQARIVLAEMLADARASR